MDRSIFWRATLGRVSLGWYCVLAIAGVGTTVTLAAEPVAFRAARSVHLAYPAPAGAFFYNQVVVERSVNGSYFMACGWNTGYFGIQQLDGPDDKVVLFSVWDPTKGDDPAAVNTEDRVEVLYHAADVRIKRFGGEGTGGQCMWKHPVGGGRNQPVSDRRGVPGREMRLHRLVLDGRRVEEARHVPNPRLCSDERLLFVHRRLSARWCQRFDSRRARFGNGWVQGLDGKWLALAKARFTASNAEWESKENIDAGVEQGEFFLETGGQIHRSRELKSMIQLTEVPSTPPAVVLKLTEQLPGHEGTVKSCWTRPNHLAFAQRPRSWSV